MYQGGTQTNEPKRNKIDDASWGLHPSNDIAHMSQEKE